MKRKGIITTVAFVLIIAIFSVGSIIAPDRSFSPNENRSLQTLPNISLGSIMRGEAQSRLNDYASDQLIFRDSLITLKTHIQYLSGKRDIGGTYIGSGGQYIEKLTENDLDAEVFNNNLYAIKTFFENTAKNSPNTKLYLLPIPTAATVVGDTLKSGAALFDEQARIARLKQIKNATYVDISPAFLNADQSGNQLYYKTDPHWTALGAHLAYTEYCSLAGLTPVEFSGHTEASKEFRGTLYSKAPMLTAPYDTLLLYNTKAADGYTVTIDDTVKQGIYEWDYLNEKDKYSIFLGGNQPLVTVSGGKGKGHLLIIRDSFASSMLPYLMENYGSVTLVDTRHFTGSVNELVANGGYTDIMVMLGLKNLVSDKSVPIILG